MGQRQIARRHPEADAEAKRAAEHYAGESDNAAGQFVLDLEETIAKIESNPRLYPRTGKSARRALLADFPYGVIYRETLYEIQIMAIAHAKRKPGYWRNRTF
jgi:plasmid stabilization system protein ParE